MGIGEVISKAIKEKKWLSITYLNKNNNKTSYWIAVKDIDFERQSFFAKMFNSMSFKTDESWIYFEGIQSAQVIDFSTYDISDDLITKIEKNLDKCQWLNYDNFNHNILNYYNECNYLNYDPCQKQYNTIDGIDLNILRKEKRYSLNDDQVKQIIRDIYFYNINNKSSIYSTLAINCFSIDDGNNKYVVAYYVLHFDPDKKELVIDKTLRFNKSFMIDKRRHSLFNYINMNVDDFIENFEKDFNYYQELISNNLKSGEIINTRPDLMLLQRECLVNLDEVYFGISQRYNNGELTIPLKSFFGNISRRNYIRRKEPSLVLYDEYININQMRVLYNALKYPVTYVQGPPGTGKTQTILNVILSAFFNDKKTLVCSENNKPVNSIIEKINFSYQSEITQFPFLRLGNIDEVKAAIRRIKELYNYSSDKKPKDNILNSIKLTNDKNNERLTELLNIQEKRVDIENCLESSKKLVESFKDGKSRIIGTIKNKIEELENELSNLPKIRNEDIIELFTPLSQNYKLKQYLFYKSLQYINKLKTSKYSELISICQNQDEEEAVKLFNQWTQNDENIKLLSEVFPIIFSTNISSNRLGRNGFTFDLVIMDEAGQCNAATALIPISKAKSLLLVGDPNQLQPIIILEDKVNEELKEKYGVSDGYDYKKHSILDVMTANDSISQYILLKYHYRCGKKIINFSNQRYYNNNLNLQFVKNEGDVELIDVRNKNIKQKNEAFEEASAIIDYIKRNNIKNAYIITPFVNQKELINKLLKSNDISDIECGTIHSIQGAEKNTIIISSALSLKTSKQTFKWLKSNAELINVAVTRAKNKLIIATDTEALDCLSDKSDDLYNLVSYIKSNGRKIVPKNESVSIEFGKSNGSKAEDEFFATVSHFCTCYTSFDVKRNVKPKDLFNEDNKLLRNESEFDTVLYKKEAFKNVPIIAFEVNGGEHFGSVKREKSDKLKMDLCKAKGIKLIFIPNSFVKAYEYIREIIFSARNGESSIEQLLFEELN